MSGPLGPRDLAEDRAGARWKASWGMLPKSRKAASLPQEGMNGKLGEPSSRQDFCGGALRSKDKETRPASREISLQQLNSPTEKKTLWDLA